MTTPALASRLADIVGTANVLVDDAAMLPYTVDWRGAYRGRALAVVRPDTTEAVAAVMRLCAETGTSVVPQGGNTGMCGGAVPDATGTAVVVALGRMDRILSVDALDNSMVVEAGCVLSRVQDAAAGVDRLFPLSLAAEGSCQIGGNLATNAGGINVLRYGNMRDLVLGLEAVTPDGSIWNGLRALRKDNRGYDLKQLFIGSEGTLGVITRAVLKLLPRPSERITAMLGLGSAIAAVQLLSRLRERCGDIVSAYELIGRPCFELVWRHIPDTRDPMAGPHPWYVLVELAAVGESERLRENFESVLAEAMEREWIADAVIAESVAQAQALWRLRETIPEATLAEGPAFRSDVAVPVNQVPRLLTEAVAALSARWPHPRIICFGHLGDGNLHFNVLAQSGDELDPVWSAAVADVLYDAVDRYEGSFSAEHGIGQAKRAALVRYKSEAEIALMRAVKRTFDPDNRMNPGKLL